jgi:hypothetical protein
MATRQHRGENADPPVFRTRLHPMSLASGAVGTAVTLLGAWMIVIHNDLSRTGSLHVVLYGALVACLWLVGPVLRLAGVQIVVGGEELAVATPPVGRVRTARFGEIDNVVEHAGTLGRHLGYGTVVIYGRHGTGATLRHVRDSGTLCRLLTERARRAAKRAS